MNAAQPQYPSEPLQDAPEPRSTPPETDGPSSESQAVHGAHSDELAPDEADERFVAPLGMDPYLCGVTFIDPATPAVPAEGDEAVERVARALAEAAGDEEAFGCQDCDDHEEDRSHWRKLARAALTAAAQPAVDTGATGAADAWDKGYASGFSNAMRRMSDEPHAPTTPNPFRGATGDTTATGQARSEANSEPGTEALVSVVAKTLNDEGAGPGSSLHSWRCEYPDRYGPCDCVEQVALEVVLAVLREQGVTK